MRETVDLKFHLGGSTTTGDDDGLDDDINAHTSRCSGFDALFSAPSADRNIEWMKRVLDVLGAVLVLYFAIGVVHADKASERETAPS